MLDLNYLLKQEDLLRKANLLKTLKTSFESLMFDRGSQPQWHNNFNFSFNGNLSIFCKNIQEILIDGLIKSSYDPNTTLWSFITSIFHEDSACDDFKQISQKLEKGEFSQQLVYEWILNSLRQHSFLNQLNFLFKTEFTSILNSFYSRNSFILDQDFLNDFLIYIKAFELNNLKLLSKCKLNLYALLNQERPQSSETDNKSLDKSSLLEINSLSSSPLFLIESPKEFGNLKTNTNKINQHRRIHSFPNIQINLLKRTSQMEKLENEIDSNVTQMSTENLAPLVPRIILNDFEEKSLEEAKQEEEEDDLNEFSKTSVFDFINELQINSECSQLDKENSHFLLADLAISSIELIKTQQDLLKSKAPPPKMIKTSSAIQIKSVSTIRNIESFDDSSVLNSPTSQENNTNSYHSSRRSSSLSSLKVNSPINNSLKPSNSFSQLTEQKLKHNNWILNNNRINEAKLSGESEIIRSVSPLSYRSETPGEKSLFLDEGFEVVGSNKPRQRKFSWEDTEKLDSAGSISNALIRKVLNKNQDNESLIPKLSDFDFFLKYLEYQEMMQMFYFNLGNLEKLNKKASSLSLLNENSPPNLSASSIYLSHLEPLNKNTLNQTNKRLSIMSLQPVSLTNSSSSYQRVKSAALTARAKSHEINKTLKQELNTSNGRIIGDDLWAPVREQLILNLSPKQKRLEQIAQQHFRCADCGIRISEDGKQIKTFNYCEYFCKYFCRCCHTSQTSYIPAYIINLLDFRTSFEVSKKAKNFLEKIYNEPLITLESLNSSLFLDKTNLFCRIKKLRFKLQNCRSYINSCRFAQTLKNDLYAKFDDFIINDQHVYSIETLFKIKKTNYYEQLKIVTYRITEHIKSCELCSQQGYICGMCAKNDLLYPFESEKVEKCPNCLACYHRACFKSPEQCPRCIRKKNRQTVLSK